MFAALLVMFQEGGPQVGWDLVTMWHNMGFPAKSVVFILFVMSAWSVGIMIDRALMYSAARKQSRIFVQQVAGALGIGSLTIMQHVGNDVVEILKLVFLKVHSKLTEWIHIVLLDRRVGYVRVPAEGIVVGYIVAGTSPHVALVGRVLKIAAPGLA